MKPKTKIILSNLKYILSWLFIFITGFWLSGCFCENRETNNTLGEIKVLNLYISKDEEIIVNNEIIGFCEVRNRIKDYLSSDTIMNGYVKIYPDREVKMNIVNCIVEEVKKAGVDSLSLGNKNEDGLITIINNEFDYKKTIYIYTIDDSFLNVDGDSISLSSLKEKLKLLLENDGENLIVLNLRKGLSYDTCEEIERIIKDLQREKGKDSIHFKEYVCPWCGNTSNEGNSSNELME